ncbi:MAG: YraN family protein [Reyranella sp.]|jgi:putative endonuclease|nr:YraN family protein [Reyranella sp.]
MTVEARQKAYRMGHAAEWRAVWRLRLAGYSILMRRYKTKLGEIDIVARRGDLLVFVEVKGRASVTAAADALVGRQFGRVARAASLFIANHPRYAACSVRFDAVLVGGFWPRHLPGVWQPPE